jgi:hypothetical protein
MARIATEKSAPFQRIYYGSAEGVAPGIPRGLAAAAVEAGEARCEKKGEWTGWSEGSTRPSRTTSAAARSLAPAQGASPAALAQQRYMNLLDFWLYLHVPLSIAMVVLIVAHVWGALMWGGEIRFW